MQPLLRKLGSRGTLNLALLAVALGTCAFGWHTLVRGLDLDLALMAALLGTLIGWALARSPLPGWLVSLLTLVWSIETLFIRVGNLGSKISAIAGTLPPLASQLWNWPYATLEPEPLQRALAELGIGISVLALRSITWLRVVASGTPSFDPVGVALVWSFAIWMLAAWAAWGIFRRQQTLAALCPALVLLVAMLALTRSDTAVLLPFLAALLLLMAFVAYGARQDHWQRIGMDTAQDIPADIGMVVTPLVVIIVTAAFLAPSLSISEIVQRAQARIEEQVGDANRLPDSFGVNLAPRPTTIFDPVRAPGLPRQHLLGSGPELSQRMVMIVTPDVPGNFYWRSTTYDQYTGRGWVTSATEIKDYDAGQPASAPVPSQRVVRQQVRTYANVGGLLYAAGTLITADRPFRVAWRSSGDAFSASIAGDTFRVDSAVPNVGEEQLRGAGANYPDWVSARYLKLPQDVPARVLALARDLTAIEPTPSDRARALEGYLRAIPYTLDLPAPPSERDVVDYFLFDLKKGYCDYTSSAMVVLARAAGLPARVVVGYTSGNYDEDNARYIVSEANAHAWAEVYFPEYGWVEFEPTGAFPSLNRAGQPQVAETPLAPREPLGPSTSMPRWEWLALVGAGGALILIVWWVTGDWRLHWLSPQAAITMIFGRIARATAPHAADTPSEIAERLVAREPQCKIEVDRLTRLYVQARYSQHAPSAADRVEAIRLWQRVRTRRVRTALARLGRGASRRDAAGGKSGKAQLVSD